MESNPTRIAVIAAHPDDAEIWCGGTICKHTSRGDQVRIFAFFQQTQHRIACATESAKILQADYMPSRTTKNKEGIDPDYRHALTTFQPNIIITHWQDDSHPDHSRTFEIARRSVIDLVRAGVPPQALFSFTTYHNRGMSQLFQPDFYIDISAEWDAKVSAIMVHDDQDPEEIVQDITPLFGLHGRTVGHEYVEVFREVPIFGRFKSRLRCPSLLS